VWGWEGAQDAAHPVALECNAVRCTAQYAPGANRFGRGERGREMTAAETAPTDGAPARAGHPGDALSLRRRIALVLVLGALTALGPFTIDMYLPAFPALEADFATTTAAVQLTLAGTMAGFGFGQLLIGPLSDRIGRRAPLVGVTAVHVGASVAASFAPSIELLGVARVAMGLGAAAGGVVAMAVVRDLFGGRRLVIMLSRLSLVMGIAPVVAPILGSALLPTVSWRAIFVVLAAYGALVLAAAVAVVPETLPRARRAERDAVTAWQRYRAVLSDRIVVGVLLIGAMGFSGLFTYLSSSSFLIQQTYGFSPQEYGLVFAVNSVGMLVAVQITARLAARFGPQWVMAFSTVGLVAAAAAIVLCDQLDAGVWGVLVPLFAFVVACGFTFPCVHVLALDRHGSAAGTAASLVGATNFGVAGLTAPLVGWVSGETGITATAMGAVMCGCALVCVLALWVVVRPSTVPQLTP
jgi:MFS transporter, DHA1 family, multidrug resistance protein